jgi:hypothetical protein
MAILQMTTKADGGGGQLYLSPIYRPIRMVGRGKTVGEASIDPDPGRPAATLPVTIEALT